MLLAAADTFRAAAIEQLEEWGRRADVDVIRQAAGADPAAVVFDAVQGGHRARQADVLLVDTAGRLHTKSNLMDELVKLKRVVARQVPGAPHEIADGAGGAHRPERARAGAAVPRGGGPDRPRAHQARRHRQGRHRGAHPPGARAADQAGRASASRSRTSSPSTRRPSSTRCSPTHERGDGRRRTTRRFDGGAALELAGAGPRPDLARIPMVGAVVVRDGAVVGRGLPRARRAPPTPRSRRWPRPARGRRGATLYVTLEPCNHQGRTPPCVEAILAAGVRRVVAAARPIPTRA